MVRRRHRDELLDDDRADRAATVADDLLDDDRADRAATGTDDLLDDDPADRRSRTEPTTYPCNSLLHG